MNTIIWFSVLFFPKYQKLDNVRQQAIILNIVYGQNFYHAFSWLMKNYLSDLMNVIKIIYIH